MTASVQDSRIKRRFELWDTNGDGTIDRSDWETEARRILKAFGEQDSSPKGRALMNAYLGMWQNLSQKVRVPEAGKVTLEQFQQFADQEVVAGGDSGFDRTLRPTIEAMVDLCDTDGDGQVSPTEFTRWLKAMGVNEAQGRSAFEQIDANGDGHLSVDELVNAVRDYHQGKNDIPLLGR